MCDAFEPSGTKTEAIGAIGQVSSNSLQRTVAKAANAPGTILMSHRSSLVVVAANLANVSDSNQIHCVDHGL